MQLLWVGLAMAVSDAVGVLLVVAEARGRALLAGALDAASDLANVGVTVYGAGFALQHGWGARTLEVLAVMCATSFVGTFFWTIVGRAITSD